MLEPAALCKPVLIGPHTFNFEEITRRLIDSNAALRIHRRQRNSNRRSGACSMSRSFATGWAGLGFKLVKSGQGALDRTLEIVDSLLIRATD